MLRDYRVGLSVHAPVNMVSRASNRPPTSSYAREVACLGLAAGSGGGAVLRNTTSSALEWEIQKEELDRKEVTAE
jgi:hypothetical protein